MGKDEQAMVCDGEVLELLPDGSYKIKLQESDFIVKAYKWGKMKKNYISLLVGDRVQVELNPYDISKWRIIYRYKTTPQGDPRQVHSGTETTTPLS